MDGPAILSNALVLILFGVLCYASWRASYRGSEVGSLWPDDQGDEDAPR